MKTNYYIQFGDSGDLKVSRKDKWYVIAEDSDKHNIYNVRIADGPFNTEKEASEKRKELTQANKK